MAMLREVFHLSKVFYRKHEVQMVEISNEQLKGIRIFYFLSTEIECLKLGSLVKYFFPPKFTI